MSPQDIQELSRLIQLIMQISIFEGALIVLGTFTLIDWLFGKLAYAVDIWKYNRGEFNYCEKCICPECLDESDRRADLAKKAGS